MCPLSTGGVSLRVRRPSLDEGVLPIPSLTTCRGVGTVGLPKLDRGMRFSNFGVTRSSFSFGGMGPGAACNIRSFKEPATGFSFGFGVVIMHGVLGTVLVFFLPVFVVVFSVCYFFGLDRGRRLGLRGALATCANLLLAVVFLRHAVESRATATGVVCVRCFFLFACMAVLVLATRVFFRRASFNGGG